MIMMVASMIAFLACLCDSVVAFVFFLGTIALCADIATKCLQLESAPTPKTPNASMNVRMHKQGYLLLQSRKKTDSVAAIESNGMQELGNKLIARRKEILGPNVNCFYADEGGLVITKGEGAYLIDPDGNRYLACCNNVAGVGHSHPKVSTSITFCLQLIQH